MSNGLASLPLGFTEGVQRGYEPSQVCPLRDRFRRPMPVLEISVAFTLGRACSCTMKTANGLTAFRWCAAS
jgi:hypothetical protein